MITFLLAFVSFIVVAGFIIWVLMQLPFPPNLQWLKNILIGLAIVISVLVAINYLPWTVLSVHSYTR